MKIVRRVHTETGENTAVSRQVIFFLYTEIIPKWKSTDDSKTPKWITALTRSKADPLQLRAGGWHSLRCRRTCSFWDKQENKVPFQTPVLNPSSCPTSAVALHVRTPRLVKGECFATWLGCFTRVKDMSCGGVGLKGKRREQTAATKCLFNLPQRAETTQKAPGWTGRNWFLSPHTHWSFGC